jgi:hypothetical protein
MPQPTIALSNVCSSANIVHAIRNGLSEHDASKNGTKRIAPSFLNLQVIHKQKGNDPSSLQLNMHTQVQN